MYARTYAPSPLCEQPCLNGGECIGYNVCQCAQGYDGDVCDDAVCTQGCSNGQCVSPDVCVCSDGWSGDACDAAVCSQGCVNGACATPDECVCDAGWRGGNCTDAICTGPCVNGDCIKPDVCACHVYWEGDSCDVALCDFDCGNGVCHLPNECLCDTDWQGDRCETPTCGFQCQPAGEFCNATNACQSICFENPCVNGGVCDGTDPLVPHCNCTEGWQGEVCSEAVCAEGCVNGNCTAPDTCECEGTVRMWVWV